MIWLYIYLYVMCMDTLVTMVQSYTRPEIKFCWWKELASSLLAGAFWPLMYTVQVIVQIRSWK